MLLVRFKEAIRKNVERDREVFLAYYLRPMTSNDNLIMRHGKENPVLAGSALGSKTFRPGQVVIVAKVISSGLYTIIGEPPPGRKGSSNFPNQQLNPPDDEWAKVIWCDPPRLPQGYSGDLTIHGLGFKTGDVFDAGFRDVLNVWTAHEGIVFSDIVVSDSETATMTANVSPTEPLRFNSIRVVRE